MTSWALSKAAGRSAFQDMVNWHDTTVIAKQTQVLINLVHFICGVFCWEFVQAMPYDWDILTGKRPWKWTMLQYLLVRWAGLANVCCLVIGFNMNGNYHMNCVPWLIWVYISGYFMVTAASSLLVVRITALWHYRLDVTAISCAFWLVHLGFACFGIAQAPKEIHWDSSTSTCAFDHSDDSRWSLLAVLITDAILLTIMMIGVLRLKQPGKLWGYIYKQGILWTVIAIFAQIPIVVLPFVNLNDAMNLMFLPFGTLVLVIATTKMFRALTNFSSPLNQVVTNLLTQMRFNATIREHETQRGPDDGALVIPMDIFQVDQRSLERDTSSMTTKGDRKHDDSSTPVQGMGDFKVQEV